MAREEKKEARAMPAIPRSGKPVQFTIEHEAVEILRRLAANRHAQGILLSTLLRQEEQRRIEARRLREQATLAEVGP